MNGLRKKIFAFCNKHAETAEYHRVKPKVFMALYLFSFFPFYFGIFLAAFGAGTGFSSLSDIFLFDWKNIEINSLTVLGIIINQFGYFLPYLYILIFGKKLKWYIYFGIFAFIFIAACYFIFKFIL